MMLIQLLVEPGFPRGTKGRFYAGIVANMATIRESVKERTKHSNMPPRDVIHHLRETIVLTVWRWMIMTLSLIRDP